jgi:hypothetical protein
LANLAFFPQEYSVEGLLNAQCERETELQELKNERFIAISLGYNCFPAFHLRDHGLRIRSFPFDWNITPFKALYAILEHDFEGFVDLRDLAINAPENTIYNKRYEFKLNHDFDIVDWIETPNGLVPAAPESLAKYNEVIAYYMRRITRFYDAFSLGVPIYLFRRIISADQARQLHTLLSNKFPDAQFTLVCIEDEDYCDPHAWVDMPKNVIHYRFAAPVAHNPEKRHEGMVQLFRELGLIK